MTIPHLVHTLLTTLIDPLFVATGQELGLEAHTERQGQMWFITLKSSIPIGLLKSSYEPLLLKELNKQFPQEQCSIHWECSIQPQKTQLPGFALRGVKNTIAVASGKGGVGKSTVTVNIATALARMGARVGILDADIYGPSMPLMLGEVPEVEVRDDRYVPVAAHGVQAMSIGYLTDQHQALIWRGPMLAKSLIQMLDSTAWDNLDYLFIDLPPGTGDIQLTLVQKIPLAGAVIVTTPQHVATLDAEKALTMFRRTHINILGVIENMATHQCSHCGFTEDIFGSGGGQELCENHNVPCLGRLPLDKRIREQGDKGIPSVLTQDKDLILPWELAACRMAIALANL